MRHIGLRAVLLLPVAFVLTVLLGAGLAFNHSVDITQTATVIAVPGTKGAAPLSTKPTYPASPEYLQQELQGWVFAQANNDPAKWTNVAYPASASLLTGLKDPSMKDSIAIGVVKFDEQVLATPGEKVGFGYSQGAVVIKRWLNANANGANPNAPPASELTIVLIGDPSRPNGGIMARFPGLYIPFLDIPLDGATPKTQYQTFIVTREGDFFADQPIDPLNPLPWLGMLLNPEVHGDYTQVDVNDPNNIVTHDGNITDIFVPSKHTLVLNPVYDLVAKVGLTETPVLDSVDRLLRIINDSAYDRTTAAPTTFQPGSSIPRLIAKAPELMDAVVQVANAVVTRVTQLPVRQPVVTQRPKGPEPEVSPEAPQQDSDTTKLAADPQPSSKKSEPETMKEPKLPSRPKLSSRGNKPVVTQDSESPTVTGTRPSSRPANPGWKPGDGLRAMADRVHKLTHPNAAASGKPDKVGASSSPRKHESRDSQPSGGDSDGSK